jgi:Calcium binding
MTGHGSLPHLNKLPLIPWERRPLAVPLAQLEGIAVDELTRQVIQDWHYWVAQGYEL